MQKDNQQFPDYRGRFGRFLSMVKYVEQEIGIKHIFPKETSEADIGEIEQKNKLAKKNPAYSEESNFLTNTIQNVEKKIIENENYYYEQMGEVVKRGNRLPGLDSFSDDPVMKAKVSARWAAQNLNQYRKARRTPYFGKVIFQKRNSKDPMTLYFGKVAVDIDSGSGKVIDWRAPIADLYYKYTGAVKNAFFNVENKEIRGKINLKRQIGIEEGLITMISDGTLNEVIRELENAQVGEDDTDEMLIANLNKSADKRLGEIVATIQSEQNEIIRAPLNGITLVQGVAGAGKTTIALHRLAYLMYNNPDAIRPENVIVLAPNKIFLNYISSILPDLGVEYIRQSTIEDLFTELINIPRSYKILNRTEVLARSLGNTMFKVLVERGNLIRNDSAILKIKNVIRRKLETLLIENLNDYPYIPIYAHRLDENYVRNLFYETKDLPWEKRRRYIEEKAKTIAEHDIKDNSLNTKAANTRIKEEKKNIADYFKGIEHPTPIAVYEKLLEDPGSMITLFPTLSTEEVKDACASILETLKNGMILSNDLPILYEIGTLYSETQVKKFDYIVIDEAQDLSKTEIAVIKSLTKDYRACIVGDINQSIHSARSPQSLENISHTIFGEENLNFFTLLKSYRSTVEITNYANEYLYRLHAKFVSTPVIRHGKAPLLINANQDSMLQKIVESANRLKGLGYKSIAVTATNEKEAREIYESIKDKFEDVTYIEDSTESYNLGIHIIPSYLTKGLEFDAVIIVIAGNEESKSEQELRLEYVMSTRALHEVAVIRK